MEDADHLAVPILRIQVLPLTVEGLDPDRAYPATEQVHCRDPCRIGVVRIRRVVGEFDERPGAELTRAVTGTSVDPPEVAVLTLEPAAA